MVYKYQKYWTGWRDLLHVSRHQMFNHHTKMHKMLYHCAHLEFQFYNFGDTQPSLWISYGFTIQVLQRLCTGQVQYLCKFLDCDLIDKGSYDPWSPTNLDGQIILTDSITHRSFTSPLTLQETIYVYKQSKLRNAWNKTFTNVNIFTALQPEHWQHSMTHTCLIH